MNKHSARRLTIGATFATGLAVLAAPASATTGYFANGTSVQSKGMAGAGVAIGTGVMGMASNPAMGTRYGNQADACLSFFMPSRSTTLGGFNVQSNNEFFPVPCGGANFQMNDRSTLGVLMYGNGGMNTEYPINFFGGPAPLGVNLEQLFIQVNYAYEVSDQVSLGFAPIIAAQRFSATGLQPFALMSSNAALLTNNGDDWSYGYGFQIGALIEASETLTFGISYRSRINMQPFGSYAGLFAEAGDFDIPPTATIGLAYTPASRSDLTITAEYQRIFYSQVAAIGNTMAAGGPLGAPNGAGFGWTDMDVFRVGAEWQASPKWTMRAGLSYNTMFTDPSQATFNALAPATPQWHASIGGTMHINDRRELHVAYTHAFDNALAGVLPPPFPPAPISSQMSQHEFSFGMTWKW
ncbi:outer membrane protein transport protein [Alisedimentitalea sp. MJ-SS2]|uniref:OmpP1/FadL family transporter n=1 Tax=Aliisedimentitalea sp. MJ-SS2 TaxID=3049795 RepID=UPI00290C8E45|nr:outer membrane protein transport protein [Alisedimentitalea sp. MJ-SS2]MDU8926878.1 outer membrane protein transport protein [Alisedimentitalea sp. MJ-SS2]